MKFRFCGDLDCPDWVLSEIATLSKMTSVRIKVLVSQIISYCVQRNFNYEKVLKLAGDNSDGVYDIKGAIAAVHFIITNASKHDLDEQSLIQEIQQLGLPKENSEAMGRQYRESKDLLRESFEKDSYRISKFLSADWRVDCILGTSNTTSLPSTTSSTDSVVTNSIISSDPTLSSLPQSKIAENELGLSVHLNIKYDNRPQDHNNQDTIEIGIKSNSIQNVSFELSPAKLDVLINELSNVTKLLDTIE